MKYFEKFDRVIGMYLPRRGQGETKATQICTAVNKLIYKRYNDGDIYDNTCYLDGWFNDLSSYANWLEKYADCGVILSDISSCWNENDYENILVRLADRCIDAEYLEKMDAEPAVGSIYKCEGRYRFEEYSEEE